MIYMTHNSNNSWSCNQMLFIHFKKLGADPENKNLTEFIRLTTSDRMAHFYYGTRINQATGDLFFFKTRAFKPNVSKNRRNMALL